VSRNCCPKGEKTYDIGRIGGSEGYRITTKRRRKMESSGGDNHQPIELESLSRSERGEATFDDASKKRETRIGTSKGNVSQGFLGS